MRIESQVAGFRRAGRGEEARKNKRVSAAWISMLSLISAVWSSFFCVFLKEFFNTYFKKPTMSKAKILVVVVSC